jgi:hypothetical protein
LGHLPESDEGVATMTDEQILNKLQELADEFYARASVSDDEEETDTYIDLGSRVYDMIEILTT